MSLKHFPRLALVCLTVTLLGMARDEQLHVSAYCSYNTSTLPADILVQKLTTDYDVIIQQAQHISGMPNSDIEVVTTQGFGAYSVINAASFRRFFIYGRTFFDSVQHTDPTGLSVLSICFHELGHLYYHHPLIRSDGSHLFENQADRFSGYEMCIAGATLEQSLAAMKAFGNEIETYSHPAKQNRLTQIEEGYIDAKITVFRDTAYIRLDSTRKAAHVVYAKNTKPVVRETVITSGKNVVSADRMVRRISLPSFNLLGEAIYFSGKKQIVLGRTGKVLGNVSSADKDGDQTLDIEGVKYILKKDLGIYASAPNGKSLKVGYKTNDYH